MSHNDEHVNALRKVLEVIEAAQSGDASKAGNAEWVAWTFLANHGQAILRALSAQQPEAVACPACDLGQATCGYHTRNPQPQAAVSDAEREAWRDLVRRAWQVLDVERPNEEITAELFAALRPDAGEVES